MVAGGSGSAAGEMRNRGTLGGGTRATGEPMGGTMELVGEGREGAGGRIGEEVGKRITGG